MQEQAMNQPALLNKSQVAQKTAQSRLWADRVPTALKPYVQLTRIDLFSGSLLLYWPCTWGLSLAAIKIDTPVTEFFPKCIYFLIWATLLHSVGSTWNDICDKDYDILVERTKNRPLAAGVISVKAALLWLLPQLCGLFGLLSLLPRDAIIFGIFELLVLTPIYPFMKRITYWPQAWLGIAFTWGGLVSWAALTTPEWPVLGLLLYTGCSWTIFYDTIYAMMDKKDDPNAGIKSTATLFGNHARPILSAIALNFVLGLTGIGMLTHQRYPFFALSVLGSVCHLAWQITTVDFEDAGSCLQRFRSNGTQLGWIVWSGMAVNYFL